MATNPAAGASYMSGQGQTPQGGANRAGLSNLQTPAEGKRKFVPMSTVLSGQPLDTAGASSGGGKTLLGA